jgi:NAD(P)H-nitrite reductase large subunit
VLVMNSKEYICRCEEVTKEEVLQAIREGKQTLKSIKRATRAGMGACQGRTCSKLITTLLLREGVPEEEALELDKARFPLVPIPVSSLEIGGEGDV